MNAYEIVTFLGYSSIYPPLENLLEKLNIKWRPKITRSRLDTRYHIKEIGVWIAFTTLEEGDGVIAKSEGEFILERVELNFVSDSSPAYNGFLPYGLRAGDNRNDVREKLGTPKRINEESDNYFIDGVVWIVAYEADALKFIKFMVPDDGWRKIGLCD